MPIVGGFQHIHLVSPDPRAAAEWYVKFLGAEIFTDYEYNGARHVRMTVGDAHLYIRSGREADHIGDTGGKRPWGIHHFGFEVDDIDAMLGHVVKNGGEISTPLFTLPSGERAAYVAAPDGVHVELIEPKK